VFIVEMQTLLLCLLSCQVGEEVAPFKYRFFRKGR